MRRPGARPDAACSRMLRPGVAPGGGDPGRLREAPACMLRPGVGRDGAGWRGAAW